MRGNKGSGDKVKASHHQRTPGDTLRKVLPKVIRCRIGAVIGELLPRHPHLAIAYFALMFGLKIRIAPNWMFLGHAGNSAIEFPRNEVWTFIEIYHDNVYERELQVHKGATVIDVGAHVGFFTLKAASETGPKGKVVAIEPEPRNVELLKRNVERNALVNIAIVNKAAWNKCGKAPLYLGISSKTHSLITPSNGQIQVCVDTLDHIADELGLSHVDFVKIDTEGAELEVLKGAEDILNSDGIKLSIAAYHMLPDGSPEFPHIIDYLRTKGFQIHTYTQDGSCYIYAEREPT